MGGAWLVGDRSLTPDFSLGHFTVEIPTEDPSTNSHCAMAYINLEFDGRLGTAI